MCRLNRYNFFIFCLLYKVYQFLNSVLFIDTIIAPKGTEAHGNLQ